ncbi:MAG: hypothetical protein ABI680_19190 [Chthoniobacteraceae bacterium]
MNKLSRVLICGALTFAVGVLLARRGGHDTLRKALRSELPMAAGAKASDHAVHAREQTSEDRYGHLLSTQMGGSHLKRRHDLYEAIGELSADEVATMIDRAERLPWGLQYYVINALLERWFELDPDRACAWVREHPDHTDYWSVWGAKSPETALAEARRHPLAASTDEMLKKAIETLAGPDRKAQAERLAALPSGAARDRVLGATVTDWAKTDPGGALEFSMSLPAGGLRTSCYDVILRQWAETDPAQAAQKAGALLSDLPAGVNGNATIAIVAGAFAKQDPQAALTWLNGLPAEQRGSGAYSNAASAWAKNDPLAALAWCRDDGVDANASWASVLGAAMDKSPTETLSWVQALPPGAERDAWLEGAISHGGKLTYPPVSDATAEMVAGVLDLLPPDAQARAAYQLGWTSQHSGKIESVRAWTSYLADGPLRAAAVEAAVSYRYGGNPAGLEKQLEQFPSGFERDGALAGIAGRELDRDPSAAMQTALGIADPNLRRDSLDRLIYNWFDRSPNQARAWLRDTPGLPDDWKREWMFGL